MKFVIFLLVLLSWFPANLFSQEHDHSHARNEIGISPGVIYSPSHKEWGFGVHAHYFRTLGEHSPWSIGGGVEQVSAHGSHWTVNVGGKYEIFDKLNFGVMPGITIFKHAHEEEHAEEHHHTNNIQFSIHFELGYDLIHTKHFHLGPAIDYSWTKHDNHFMLGIHCAYGF